MSYAFVAFACGMWLRRLRLAQVQRVQISTNIFLSIIMLATAIQGILFSLEETVAESPENTLTHIEGSAVLIQPFMLFCQRSFSHANFPVSVRAGGDWNEFLRETRLLNLILIKRGAFCHGGLLLYHGTVLRAWRSWITVLSKASWASWDS